MRDDAAAPATCTTERLAASTAEIPEDATMHMSDELPQSIHQCEIREKIQKGIHT